MKAVLAACLVTAVGAVLLAAPAASAYDKPGELRRVAAIFAMRDAEVRCPSSDEWIHDPIWGIGPNPSRAWGYTNMVDDYIVLHPALCAGALAVADPGVPLWQRAMGVLVLVHEAYHMRRWAWRRNEAKVECQARGARPDGEALPGVQRPHVQAAAVGVAVHAIGRDPRRARRCRGRAAGQGCRHTNKGWGAVSTSFMRCPSSFRAST